MFEYFEKALENDKMETDCPAYFFQKGMTFEDRAKRLIRDVLKYEEKEKNKDSTEK